MKCETCRELLWAYLEQELTADEMQEMEQHFAECADCRREAEEEKEILNALRSLPEEELPEGYHAELMQKLNEAASPKVIPFAAKKKQPKWKQMSLIAAAVLIVVAAGGMSGILEMRQYSMDAASPMETAMVEDAAGTAGAVYSVEDVEEGDQKEAPERELFSAVQMNRAENTAITMDDTAMGVDQSAAKTDEAAAEEAAAPEMAYTAEEAAAPEMAYTAEEVPAPFSIARTAVIAEASEILSLEVEEIGTAKALILEKVIALGGYEELSVDETIFLAVIPIEMADTFRDSLSENGVLRQLESREPQEGEAYRIIEIRLQEN